MCIVAASCFLLVLTLTSEFQISSCLGLTAQSVRTKDILGPSTVVWLARGERAKLGVCPKITEAAPVLELVDYGASLHRQLGLSTRHLQTFSLHHILSVLTIRKLYLTVFLSPHVNTTC